eukprot:5217578-Pleurochrysis_carterae.AAC.1
MSLESRCRSLARRRRTDRAKNRRHVRRRKTDHRAGAKVRLCRCLKIAHPRSTMVSQPALLCTPP